MSTIAELAQAVTDYLNGQSLGEGFTAVRAWAPRTKLEKITRLEVIVVPRRVETAPQDRDVDQHTMSVDIALQDRIDDDDDVEGLMDLVERVRRSLAGAELPGARWARWSGIEIDPIYHPEHLEQHRVFTSVIRVSYKSLAPR